MNEEEIAYMKRAIELARKGAGLVSPNPVVGAVLVKGGKIVGEGYHRFDLLKHAEVVALERAGELARGATLYCSLEPCCHHGRTPPCTDALIEAGISRAVVAISDPNPRVNTLGLQLLREAGIDVEVGLFEEEARRLNEIYLKFIKTGLPFKHVLFIQDEATASGWTPSAEFSEMAFRYDAIVFGDHMDVNRSISGALGERARHRPLEIASLYGSPSDFLQEREGKSRSVNFSSPCELNKIISSWAGTGATSVLVLPFLRDESFLDSIRPIDKATFVQAASNDSGFRSIELVDREVTGESGYTEITGYFIQNN